MTKIKKSIEEMVEKYCCEIEHAQQVLEYSIKLFDAMNGVICDFTTREKEYLEAAAKLHDIGYCVEKKSHHKHSMAMIEDEGLWGFDEEETKIIANIARYHRNSLPDEAKHENFSVLSDEKKLLVKRLGGILRIADGLDKPHKNLILKIRAEETSGTIDFYIKTVGFKPNLKATEAKKDLFEHTFQKTVQFLFE